MSFRNQPSPIFKSAFRSPADEFDSNLGIRPVVFDILAPDYETSILPENLKMVLHINPSTMNFTYDKIIERIQTKGGFVEQHWGEGARSISFSIATGGFKRVFTGLSNITGGGYDAGGTRRETIAYDKYLDILALFHNNGAVYDQSGEIAFQGILKVTFDGGIYFGWFVSFTVTESADKPFQFDLTAEFTISHEILRLRSMPWKSDPLPVGSRETGIPLSNAAVEPVDLSRIDTRSTGKTVNAASPPAFEIDPFIE